MYFLSTTTQLPPFSTIIKKLLNYFLNFFQFVKLILNTCFNLFQNKLNQFTTNLIYVYTCFSKQFDENYTVYLVHYYLLNEVLFPLKQLQ